jgi:glycolate oxidase subunit GlcD
MLSAVDNLIENLSAIVGQENVLSEPDQLLVYECDGLPQHKHRPRAVVFPSSTEETAAIMRVLSKAEVPFTPRGAGTGLSGGALALNQGVVIELARMRKILKLDASNRIAVVQPGVVNLQVSRAAASFGLHYVPDPSSQPTCTIGGNIAESAGGVHCLKYGTTTDHVLGCRVVLAGGGIVDLGGAGTEQPGYDLLGTFIGSEGTFGIATEATLRLVQIPPAVRTLLAEFAEVNDASHAVSAIIAAGVMPAALEMMDREIIRAVEASVFAAGLPPDAGAALIIELDGIEAGIDDETERVKSICMEYGARNCRLAHDENERKRLWAARKGAFGAIGRISPDSMIQDAVVPRSRLPEVLAAAYQIAAKYQLRIANVFHAGDGNLHPLICFDSRFPEQVLRVKEAGGELMQACVNAGGTITGEHGVGLDKRELLPLVFSEDDMETMLQVRAAFDPRGLCNPGKIIPLLRGCGEARAVSVQGTIASGFNEGTKRPEEWETRRHGHAETGDAQYFRATSIVSNSKSQLAISTPRAHSFDSESAAHRIAQVVGQEHVSVSPSLRLSGSCVSVAPGSIDEISEVMKLASSVGWTVVPVGGGSWFDVDNAIKRTGVILSTRRLNKILEHEPADLIAVSEAGVRLSEFNDTLALNGQWLPLDPPDDGSATIGGVVATGVGGAQQWSYGRPRGSVIGMRVVLADGRIIKAGGRVVKNVAGYDLCKLFTGSYGTLGIIAEVNFKLRPKPARETTVVATGPPAALISRAQSILEAGLFPVATELVSSGVANLLDVAIDKGSAALLVRFAGNEKGVEYQTNQALFHLVQDSETREAEVVAEDAGLWESLASVPLRSSQNLCWRASVLPAGVHGFVDSVRKIIGQGFSSSLWQLGVADGRMRMLSDAEGNREETVKLIQELRAAARLAGGTLIIENADEEISRRVDPWEEIESAKDLMDRIKSQLDPQGILPFLNASSPLVVSGA